MAYRFEIIPCCTNNNAVDTATKLYGTGILL